MRRFGLLLALAVGLVALPTGCSQANTPMDPGLPPADEQTPTLGGGDYDPIDDFLREGTAVIDGDVTINGLTETDPNYEPGPYVVTQPARTGDIAIFRVKAHLTNNATTTLYTKQTSPTKNYSSFSVPGTNVDQYKAMYVTGTEPLSITFYNSTSYNTPANSKAAIYDYNFKTQAAENAGEPNDDDNGATITDRSLANNLVSGVTATRSVFSFDPATRDVEEWYKTTIGLAGEQFSFKYTTTSGRFGTWSYTLKVFDPNGVQMGSTVNVPAGNAAATVTRTATMAGTYYLQMVGTPVTKNNTNVYYNLYTMTACIKPRLIDVTIGSTTPCPGALFTWNAEVANGVTSYLWNFGGGASPNTSTAASPTVTAGAPGLHPFTLTLTNGCESTVISQQFFVGCLGGVGIQGASSSEVLVEDLIVEPNGTTHVLSHYKGAPDLDPGTGVNIQGSVGNGLALATLNASGDLTQLVAIPAPEGTNFSCEALAYHSSYGYAICGRFDGTIDFDPGEGVALRNDEAHGDTFLLGLAPNGTFKFVSCINSAFPPAVPVIRSDTGEIFLLGSYSNTVDFDPGPSVFSRTSVGGTDPYCMLYDSLGRFINGVVWGGEPEERIYDAVINGPLVYLVGDFTTGTTDLDPGPGIVAATASGGSSAYLTQLLADSTMTYNGHIQTTGGTASPQAGIKVASGGVVYLAGNFSDTVDFESGVGTQNRTSLGSSDVYVLRLSPNLFYDWVYTVGGTEADGIGDLALKPDGTSLRVYGSFSGTVQFNPLEGTDFRSGTNAAFILAINSNGFHDFSSVWDGDFLITSSIGVDSGGMSRAGGYFNGLVDFDPGAGVTGISSLGTVDGFIQRVNSDGIW